MDKICSQCDTKNSENSKFCENCGNELHNVNKTETKSKNNTIIAILIAIAVILFIATAALFIGSSSVPTQSQDFGGITMLVPQGSNFVKSNSLPNFGTIGGFVIFENTGQYKDKVNNVMFSTIKGANAPSEVVLDRTNGDVKIYKDRNGEHLYYFERQIGDYRVSLIGRDQSTMLEMINSVQIKNPTLNI